MITIDGVMQAPGSPEEDPSGGFEYGGWVAPYGDAVTGEIMERLMQPADLLLGRHTFDIWEAYWPVHASGWPGINEVRKYVYSTTRTQSDWNNTVFVQTVDDVRELKATNGTDIQVWGSAALIQLLLKNDLVDELWLMIHPLTLGNGKKLFSDGPIPAAFTLNESTTSTNGVILAHYSRAGAVRTGTIA